MVGADWTYITILAKDRVNGLKMKDVTKELKRQQDINAKLIKELRIIRERLEISRQTVKQWKENIKLVEQQLAEARQKIEELKLYLADCRDESRAIL